MFPDLVWRIETEQKELYLSFDDGPIPEVTPWVLDQLDHYQAKASFFCVGQNIERYPSIFEELHRRGHTIGNHSYNHLSGWGSENIEYIRNVRKGARISGSKLYRPPYGKLRPSQSRFLKHHYVIVMWDVLSGDFDAELSAEACYQNVLRKAQPGSIIVFHDSLKAKAKLTEVLPRVLEHFSNEGYQFKAINPADLLSKKHLHSYSEFSR